ncbi:MAG: helix-turn-helix domain-containing protein [Armatimonadia bacterium]|nr:helix-turn-helix domain-containing protein [Armatimonadia bacterium]
MGEGKRPPQLNIDFTRTEESLSVHLRGRRAAFSERTMSLPERFGTGRMALVQIDDACGFCGLISHGSRDEFKARAQLQADAFKVTYHASAEETEVTIDGVRRSMIVRHHDSYILSPSVVAELTIRPSSSIHELTYFITPDRLFALLEDELDRVSPGLEEAVRRCGVEPFFQPGSASHALRAVVDQIHHCALGGNLRRLYMEGKLREFFALRLAAACRIGVKEVPIVLSVRDAERLEEARELLDASIAAPPSLALLARRVGLNTTRLKRGFKARFGTTVFGYVRDRRMAWAYELLIGTDENVSEVAYRVGYRQTAAFCTAFRRAYGSTPGTIARALNSRLSDAVMESQSQRQSCEALQSSSHTSSASEASRPE